LVAAPLVLLSLSVIGVAINTYASNVAQDVAVEAARYGSLADSNLGEAQSLAIESLKSALGSNVDADVAISRFSQPCATAVTVRLRAIALGLLSSNRGIEEKAIEICEIQF
jgi:hypothetical protein